MIIAQLAGGLGNQMLRYACGGALAHRLGVEFFLDFAWLERTYRETAERRFQLDAF